MYSFPNLNQFIVPCLVLTFASWPDYRFLRRQVRWSGILLSLRIFLFVVIHTVKGFSILNEEELDVFLELPFFLYSPTNVGNLIYCLSSSAFSKSSLNIWKFMVHVLWTLAWRILRHYFTSMWDECNCAVVWTFFGNSFLCHWNENWPFYSPVATAEFSKFADYFKIF